MSRFVRGARVISVLFPPNSLKQMDEPSMPCREEAVEVVSPKVIRVNVLLI